MRWQYETSDIAPGNAIVAIFKPFLIDMLRSKPSRTTFNRHRDNLWQVGGEFIRLRYEHPDLHRMPIDRLIQHLIEADGGPSSGRAFPSQNKTPSMPPVGSFIASLTPQPRQNDQIPPTNSAEEPLF